MIYAYHTFSRGREVPPDKYRRSEEAFKEDLKKMQPEDEIQIDDAMSSARDIAVPILMKEFKTATIFVPTSKVGSPEFMTAGDIAVLSKEGFDIGSHSHEHTDMRQLSLEEVETHLKKSIELIELWTKKKPAKFMAPYELYTEDIVRIARSLGLEPTLERKTVYNTTEFMKELPDVSSAEYWNDIFSPKIKLVREGDPSPKLEPGGHEVERYTEVLKWINKGGPILDVGAGWADLAKMLKAKWPERKVVALDQSDQAAKRAGFSPYYVATCYKMPFAYKEFEYVCACSMLEYLQDEDRAINEFARVGNRGIFVVPFGKLEVNSQLRKYTLESLREMLKGHGKSLKIYRQGPMLVVNMEF